MGPNFCPLTPQLLRTFSVNKQKVQFLSCPIIENTDPSCWEGSYSWVWCSKWNNHYDEYSLNKNVWDFGAEINKFISSILLKSRSPRGFAPWYPSRVLSLDPARGLQPQDPRLFLGELYPSLHFKITSYTYESWQKKHTWIIHSYVKMIRECYIDNIYYI